MAYYAKVGCSPPAPLPESPDFTDKAIVFKRFIKLMLILTNLARLNN